jgi:hypothetical protein
MRLRYWNGLLFVASFICGRPLIVLIYTFVEWSHASENKIISTTGYITTESWACAASRNGDLESVGSICTELRAAQYLLIPEVVLGAGMLLLVIWMTYCVSKEQGTVEQAAPGDSKV